MADRFRIDPLSGDLWGKLIFHAWKQLLSALLNDLDRLFVTTGLTDLG